MPRPMLPAGLEELPRLLGVVIGFLVLMLATVTVLLYLDARALAPAERLEKLAGGGFGTFDLHFALLVLTGLGVVLRCSLFIAPELDAMLVSPLTGPQIFWSGFKRVLRPLLIAGGVLCLPFWGHLLGLGADVWLLVATVALLLACLVLLLATAALLALAGMLACYLPLVAVVAWSLSTGKPLAVAGLVALASAMAWHPVVSALLGVVVACALVLGLDGLLVRRRYSRDALIAWRDRPESWWLGLSRPGHEAVRGGSGPASGVWLLRRLDGQAHGLWRLLQRDEMPEAFARRIPWALACGGAWLAATHWRFGGVVESADEDVLLLGVGFVFAWLVAFALLVTPSGRPWLLGRTPAESPVIINQPLQEIFPVDPRVYLAAVFCCGTFQITLSLLLLAPFALLSPFPADSVTGSLVFFWVALELLLGLALFQVSPQLDPRRRGLIWWRVLWVSAAVVAGVMALFWLFFGVLEHFFWILAALGELFRDHPAASAGLTVLVFALLELLVILASLRRHEKRWFDAAW